MEWRNLWRGLIMGTSDLIPGVSGGTLAVVLGIYHRLMEAINGIFSRKWKKHLGFLIPLGLGIITAIFSLSYIIDYLITNYDQQTFFFFLGLIIGIIPYLLKKVDFRHTYQPVHFGLLTIAAVVVILIGLLQAEEGTTAVTTFGFSDYLVMFGAGFIASSALVLPGISGSFILLVLGLYPTVINAIKSFHIPIITIVGLGIGVGIIVTSKIVYFFLERYTVGTYAVVTGLVFGSAVVIFPGFAGGFGETIMSLVTLVLGLVVAMVLGRVEHD